eukprot:4742753-Pleurochrysis_carterae.AAC.1
MPYTGLRMRHTRVLPSDPAATKSHRRIDSPRLTASTARVRRDVARIVAQKRAAALPLVHPDQTHQRATRGNGRAIDELPAAVVGVICDFSSFCGRPPCAIVTQDLFAVLRIDACCGGQERRACVVRVARA